MSFTKQERIEGNKLFTRLVGDGFYAKPAYKGGLFEAKVACPDVWNGYRPDHISKVINSLSEKEINNLAAFDLLLKEAIGIENTDSDSIRFDVATWLDHPAMKLETKQKAFESMCHSFANTKQAIKAKKFYEMFFRTCDNPWTREEAQKPGFSVIPYFQATDSSFPFIVPPHNKDQLAYRKEMGTILKNRKFSQMARGNAL